MEYSRDDYKFPEAYVEGIESDVYMIVYKDRRAYRLTEKPEGPLSLGRTIYEQALGLAIDLEKAETKRHVAVRVPWKGNRAMLLEPGAKVILYEVSGVQAVFYAHEGDDLRRGDVLAYVLTGKGETRTIRVQEEVTVFYIAWIPGTHPPRYIAVLADPESLIILREEA